MFAARHGGIFNDGNSADVIFAHHPPGLGDGRGRRERDRIGDDAVLASLHLFNFAGLIFDGEILVDDPDSPFLGQRNGQGRVGHGIHWRRNQRDVQVDRSGEPGMGVGVGGNKVAASRNQKHVIEGDSIMDDLGVFHGAVLRRLADRVNIRWGHSV